MSNRRTNSFEDFADRRNKDRSQQRNSQTSPPTSSRLSFHSEPVAKADSIGKVTQIDKDCGVVNDEVFFSVRVCRGQVPKLGSRVLYEAHPGTSTLRRQCSWIATRIQELEPPSSSSRSRSSAANKDGVAPDTRRRRCSPEDLGKSSLETIQQGWEELERSKEELRQSKAELERSREQLLRRSSELRRSRSRERHESQHWEREPEPVVVERREHSNERHYIKRMEEKPNRDWFLQSQNKHDMLIETTQNECSNNHLNMREELIFQNQERRDQSQSHIRPSSRLPANARHCELKDFQSHQSFNRDIHDRKWEMTQNERPRYSNNEEWREQTRASNNFLQSEEPHKLFQDQQMQNSFRDVASTDFGAGSNQPSLMSQEQYKRPSGAQKRRMAKELANAQRQSSNDWISTPPRTQLERNNMGVNTEISKLTKEEKQEVKHNCWCIIVDDAHSKGFINKLSSTTIDQQFKTALASANLTSLVKRGWMNKHHVYEITLPSPNCAPLLHSFVANHFFKPWSSAKLRLLTAKELTSVNCFVPLYRGRYNPKNLLNKLRHEELHTHMWHLKNSLLQKRGIKIWVDIDEKSYQFLVKNRGLVSINKKNIVFKQGGYAVGRGKDGKYEYNEDDDNGDDDNGEDDNGDIIIIDDDNGDDDNADDNFDDNGVDNGDNQNGD